MTSLPDEELRRWPQEGLSASASWRRERLVAIRTAALAQMSGEADQEFVRRLAQDVGKITDDGALKDAIISWPTNTQLPTSTVAAILGQVVASAEDELDELARLSPQALPPPRPEPTPPPKEPPRDPDATKQCPDCAETVKAQAKVCRFCGHRFDGGKLGVAISVLSSLATGPDFVPVGASTRLFGRGLGDRDARKRAKAFLKSQHCHAESRFQGAIAFEYPDIAFDLGAKAMLKDENGYGNLLGSAKGFVFLRLKVPLFAGESLHVHEMPFADVEWVKADPHVRTGSLRVAVPGHIWEFFSIRPKARTKEFERLARARGVG